VTSTVPSRIPAALDNPAYQAYLTLRTGFVVAVRPKVGGYLVAAWLAGIIGNLLLLGDHDDVALRDLGLLLAALALARLATAFRPAHGAGEV
jgi:hypothetical protein